MYVCAMESVFENMYKSSVLCWTRSNLLTPSGQSLANNIDFHLSVEFPGCVVKLPLSVKLSILPSKNSSCRYAALGAYCGTTVDFPNIRSRFVGREENG